MIEIDGSYGEGGGQILRNAIALSILTNNPVKIHNIRANRPQPGLKPQHNTVLRLLQTLSEAETSGVHIGSSTINFSPYQIQSGSFKFDVGTAGSMVLIYEAVLFACLTISEPITIELTGGSDVKWAPSWDYFAHVFLPFLQTMGISSEVTLKKRGYYPKGGGNACLVLQPPDSIQSVSLSHAHKDPQIRGHIHSYHLPDHISDRMKISANTLGNRHNCSVTLSIDHTPTASAGVVMTLWTQNPGSYLGCVGLGEKGKKAEDISHRCMQQMIDMVNNKVTVDPWLCDQILGFLLCAPGDSTVSTPYLSHHAKTNMWVIQQFFPDVPLFEIMPKNDMVTVVVHGQDLVRK